MTAPSRPRVLMVTGAYYPEISSGGVQCQMMARMLSGRAEVEVLTTAVDPTLARRDRVDGIAVTRIVIDVRSRLSRARAGVAMTAALLRMAARADVVHLHGCSAKNVVVTAIATLLRRPIVLSLHTSGHDEPEAIRRQGRFAWWAFRAADRCLSVSPGLVQAYLAAGLPRERIRLVPNGIDTTRFAPVSEDERMQLRQRLRMAPRPVILFVGFFSEDKQPRVLFDAWLSLLDGGRTDATLVFVGATESAYFEVDGDMAARMRLEADRKGLGDRLMFAGVTHQVQDYYRAADVFVLPSRREGLPVALLEAMACGLPSVASRLPGATDGIIDDGRNGVLVPVGDAAAFATAIDGLLSDPVRAAAMGAAARQTVVERFDSADIADRWLESYDLSSAGVQG